MLAIVHYAIAKFRGKAVRGASLGADHAHLWVTFPLEPDRAARLPGV